MINFLINTFIWTFALYGLFHFIFSIFRTYYHCKISSEGIYFFIAVKNQENKIEGFLRSILFRVLYGDENILDNIYVIDLNSTDKTPEILDILSSDYNCVKITDVKHCKKILDSVSESK